MLNSQALLFNVVVVATFSHGLFNSRFAQGSVQPGLALPGAAKPGQAQANDTQPHWTDSTTTRIKPEMKEEFEADLKQLVAANRKAGTLWFLTFETFAGDTTEYMTVAPVIKFGDLDGPSAVVKALGATEWNRLAHDMRRCYTAQTRRYATPHTELDIGRAYSPAGAYWLETSTLVKPGKLNDYLNWLANDYRPALEKAGVTRFRVSQPIFGAPSGEIVATRMLASLAEIDEGSILSKALSEEDARTVAAKSVPLVRSSHSKILRIRIDLSYPASK